MLLIAYPNSVLADDHLQHSYSRVYVLMHGYSAAVEYLSAKVQSGNFENAAITKIKQELKSLDSYSYYEVLAVQRGHCIGQARANNKGRQTALVQAS